jgi:hypothetical protein
VREELWWFGHREVEAEHADVHGHRLDGVGPRDQYARVIIDGFDDAYGWIYSTQNVVGGRTDGDPGVHIPASECRSAEHESRVVTAR